MTATPRPSSGSLPRPLSSRPAGRAAAGTSWLIIGSLVGGVAAYAFQVVGSRVLGDAAFAPIGVLWTIQYLVVSIVLFSIETYVTRTAARDRRTGQRRLRGQLGAIAAWIAGSAVVLGGVTWTLRGPLFGGDGLLAAVVAAIIVAYGAFVVVRGDLAGHGRYRAYGLATATESVVRLGLAVVVLQGAASSGALAAIMPVGAALAALWWPVARRGRDPEPTRRAAGVEGVSAARFLVPTTLANAASQTLLAAGPLVLVVLNAAPGQISVFFVTVTAARVPIMLALGGLLSRLLPPLTAMAEADPPRLRRLALLVGAASALLSGVGAVAGGVLGPALVRLAFGPSFTPSPVFTAATGAGVLLASGALVLNQVTIARAQERRLLLPWTIATATAAIAVVIAPGDPVARVSTAFVAGEIAAVAGLLLVNTRRGRRSHGIKTIKTTNPINPIGPPG